MRRGDRFDRDAVVAVASEQLGDPFQVHSVRRFHVIDGEFVVAERAREIVGFVSYDVIGRSAELLAVATSTKRLGLGRRLIGEVERLAVAAGHEELMLVTTDANTTAQAFYAAVGFTFVKRRIGAVDECRRLYKPSIPPEMHDELVYRKVLLTPRPRSR